MWNSYKKILFFIILLGFSFRIFNSNWDSGFMFHPDERAIYMFTIPIALPSSINEFLSPESSLNPNFFAYGNLPIYLLKIVSSYASVINPAFSEYSGIFVVGRIINAVFDTLTILIIFLLARKLFNIKAALLSSFFYSIAVFPIQNSHFYSVDISLTFFTLLTLLFLSFYMKTPNLKNALLTGLAFGLALATKISVLPFIFVIALGFITAKNSQGLTGLRKTW